MEEKVLLTDGKTSPTKDEEKTGVSVDEMLTYVGEFKQFQWLLDVVFCIMVLAQTYQVLIMYFAALNSTWHCVENSTSCTYPTNLSIASDNSSRCSMPRSAWEFTESKDFSIVTQFDIYCDSEWQIHLTTSIMFIGWAIGAVVLGWCADMYGRKSVLFPATFVVLLVGFLSAFLPNIWWFTVFRFFLGFFTPGTSVQMFIMISEFVGSKYRPIAGIVLWFFFTLALCILGLKAYFIRQWKILFIVCTAPYIFFFVFYKFVPESVRWLRLHGRIDEAMDIFKRMAKWNKTTIPENITLSMPSEKALAHKASPMDLFAGKKMAVSTLVQGYSWMVNGLVYYGLSLAASDLGGSLYRNYVLLAVVEFPAIIMAMDFCERFGRKKTVITSLFLGSLACIIVAFIPTSGDIKILRILLGMLGKMCITLSFDSIYTWSVEIYPTNIRAEGMGFLQVSSRIGAASAPWVAKGLTSVHKSVPFILMGAAAFVAAGLSCLLPETRGMATSETGEETEEEMTQMYDTKAQVA